MELTVQLDPSSKQLDLFGPADSHLRLLRRSLAVSITARQSNLIIGGAESNVNQTAEAVDRMQDADFQVWQKTLARGVLNRDTSYAVALIENMDNEQWRIETLSSEISSLGSSWVRDIFPAPGGPNRLPEFERRYEEILAAVEAGDFKPEQREKILNSVHGEFANKVPAASEAAETRNPE